MFYTFFVYFSLFLFSLLGVSLYQQHKLKGVGIFILLLVAFVIGGRYNVGTDWPNYYEYYSMILKHGISYNEILNNGLEPMYLILNAFFAFFKLSPSFFFTGVALIQFILLILAVDKKILLPWVFFFFYTLLFSMSLNIQRQMLAVSIFLVAAKYIDKSKIKYILLVNCAFLFHYSAVILLPLVFVDHRLFHFLEKRIIVLTLFFVTLFFRGAFMSILEMLSITGLMNAKYTANMENLDMQMEVSSGLGILAKNFLSVVSIYYMPMLIKYYKKDFNISFLYRLFIIGLLLSNVFDISVFLSRVPLPLTSLKIIIYAALCQFLLKGAYRKIDVLIGVGFVMLSFLMFVMGIANGSGGITPYQFKWI